MSGRSGRVLVCFIKHARLIIEYNSIVVNDHAAHSGGNRAVDHQANSPPEESKALVGYLRIKKEDKIVRIAIPVTSGTLAMHF